MEITVLSAQGLKNTSCKLLSKRIRPFITITTYPPTPANPNGGKQCHVYKTRVDDQGGVNPTWGDKFYLPVDNTFFANTYSCICLQLYTKRLIAGQTLLGWCEVPVKDIVFPPSSVVKYLSYRLRDRDGTRGHGVVNLAIKLESLVPVPVAGERSSQPLDMDRSSQPLDMDKFPVLGIPVTMSPRVKHSR